MYIKFRTVCTLLICLTFVPVNYPQEFQKCLTFSEEILNQELLARPLHNRPETQIPTDHFIIHFIDIELHPTDPDATDYGYAAFVATTADQVWNKEVNQFGWPQPPGDGTIGGGTNKYDIYLLHLSDGEYPDPYGYTKPEDQVPGTNGYTSYVVVTTGIVKFEGEQWRPMTEDERKATVAHEFHHAIQDGLTWLKKDMNKNSWFYENTSTWMEEICYPEVDDWIVALINDPNITTTCLKKPNLPIDHWGNTNEDQYQYSGALFCHTMSKWKGNPIIKDIWLRAKNTTVDFVNDIDYVLTHLQEPISLNDVLKRYAVWRYYTGDNDDGNHFDKASLMEGLHILREHNSGTGSGNSSPDNLNSKGGTSYIVFKNANGVININFNGQDNAQFSTVALNKRIYFSDIENIVDDMKNLLRKQSVISYNEIDSPEYFSIASQLIGLAEDLKLAERDSSYSYTEEELNETINSLIPEDFDSEKNNELLKDKIDLLSSEFDDNDFVKKFTNGKKGDEAVEDILSRTFLTSADRIKEIVENEPDAILNSDDPFIEFVKFSDEESKIISARTDELAAREATANQKLGRALFEVYGTSIPPDATFTLRISDGIVKGFDYNGTVAPPITTFYGLLDRYYSFDGEFPWNLHERWLDAPEEFDFSTPFNFVTTNDVIGGNSGSPIINKDAEIVGVAFDGNIQSLPGDFIYDPEVNRSVDVHSAGMLEAIKDLYEFERLAEELTLGRISN